MNLKIPANEWYGWKPEELHLPDDWNIKVQHMKGHDAKALTQIQITEKIQKPIGTPTLRELSRGKHKIAIIFDDMTRPTKTWQMLPAILDELYAGGINGDKIVFVMASGAHSGRMLFDFQKKLGESVPETFLIFNHNPYENLVDLGETSNGTPVQVNKEVMSCDLKITVGAVMPHFGYGFGGGSKMLLPGVSGIDSITLNHRIRKGTGSGSIDKNIRRLDSEEAARMAGVDFVVNALLNTNCDVSELLCGDLIEAHREAVSIAREHYVTEIVRDADISICNGYPMANEGYKAYHISLESVREGGDIVFLLHTPEGCRVHYYNGRFGTNFGGRGWRPDVYIKDPWKMDRILVVSPNIMKTDEPYYGVGSIWKKTWGEVLKLLRAEHGPRAKVAVYPTAAMQISKSKTCTDV